MKKIYIIALSLSAVLFSCSSDNDNGTPIIAIPAGPQYAMTAKLNGATFQANNPFGNNEYSDTNIFSYYPQPDYFMLQGRSGGVLGNPEINLWIKRSDMAVGTYPIGQETFDTPPSHYIDLIDNSNDEGEYTKEGVIVITEINVLTKTIKGTFTFKSATGVNDPAASVNFNVTDGTFNYIYE